MKAYQVFFTYPGMGTKRVVSREIKARTFNSLKNKAWDVVGDRDVFAICAFYEDPKSEYADAQGRVKKQIFSGFNGETSDYNELRKMGA